MLKLSEITRYLITDIRQAIVSEVSQLNVPDNTIDLSGVIIFDNAAGIVNDLLQNGYRLVDTADAFRNGLLQKNHCAAKSEKLTDVGEAPPDYEQIKTFIQAFNEEDLYNCCSGRIYPQITLTQLSRPAVRWTFSGDSWIEYGKYIASRIYYRNGSPKMDVFIETMRNSDRLFIVRNNSFVEFENTFDSENGIARVPYIDGDWTWKEIFYRAVLIPAEFGKVKLTDKQPWKDAIPSILRDCLPSAAGKITLNQYMRGTAYVSAGKR